MAGYREIERSGKTFIIKGSFGNVHVYLGKQCLAFGIMTFNDAENWIYSHYPDDAEFHRLQAHLDVQDSIREFHREFGAGQPA